jgi:uncharacterized protein YecT (DUF1311 family)
MVSVVTTGRKHLGVLLLVGCATTAGTGAAGAIAGASSAGSPPMPTYGSKCEKTALSQMAMDKCVAGELAQLNTEMTVALNDEADQFAEDAVVGIQQKWLHFEQAECYVEDSPYKGGTIQPLIFGVCERGLMVQRIAEIDAVIKAAPH